MSLIISAAFMTVSLDRMASGFRVITSLTFMGKPPFWFFEFLPHASRLFEFHRTPTGINKDINAET
jgi:hypothetical protein